MPNYRRVVVVTLGRDFKAGDQIRLEMLDTVERRRVIDVEGVRNGLAVPVTLNESATWTETADLIPSPVDGEDPSDRWKRISKEVDASLDAITSGRAS